MTKGTQLWPNDRMRAFFHAHIRRETALDDAAVDRLTASLLKAVNRMLVWEMPEPVAADVAPAVVAAPPTPPAGKTKTKGGGKIPVAKAGDGKAAESKQQPPQQVPQGIPGGSSRSQLAQTRALDSKAAAGSGANGFDPYAFSATVVLAKTGREGLIRRLADIKTVEHLKKFADAQHLGIDRNLAKADELRKAIVAAAEQRLADRRAAAS